MGGVFFDTPCRTRLLPITIGSGCKGGLTLSDIPKTIAKTNLLHLFLDIVLVVLGNCFMHINEDAIS